MIRVALLALMLCACTAPPLPHSAYVWQREWRASLQSALLDKTQPFAEWRVLLFEVAGAQRTPIRIDATVLAQSGKPVRAVVRIEGARIDIAATDLAAWLAPAVGELRRAGVTLTGIEIDHDCATAALSDYAIWLHTLRAELPSESLSITVLPTWIDAAALPQVLAATTSSVLQVHAISHPRQGLFDSARALRWIQAYARLGRRFEVALPAYHVAVTVDGNGSVRDVRAEEPGNSGGSELRSDPSAVVRLLGDIRSDPPDALVGIVWFRLPLIDDVRAWHPATLRAAVRGEALHGEVRIELRRRDGVREASARGVGNLDAPIPPIDLPSDCRYAGSRPPFELHGAPGAWRLVPVTPQFVAPGQLRIAGWCR
jgi:hypothetical protein